MINEAAVQPLAGVRVVDLTQALAGPYATLLLADAGADVVKVERPGDGDVARGWGPPFVKGSDGVEVSAYFLSINRGKRSIELDLKDPADHAQLIGMIETADVVCENFRAGAMTKLGLDPEELIESSPELTVMSISAFGEGGPDGHRAGFDQILQGESGLMSVTGEDRDHPLKFGVPIADMLAGLYGAFGVTLALQERERTGRGRWVRTSLLESMLAVHAMQGARWLIGGEVPEPEGNKHPTIAPYNTYYCSDGPLNIAIGTEALWRAFAPLVGLEHDDPRFAANPARLANSIELDEIINSKLANGTVDEWFQRLDAAGLPVGRVRRFDSVYAMEQVDHLGFVRTLDHPTVGPIDVAGPALRFGEAGYGASEAPPILGQHNDDFAWRAAGRSELQ